jgi:hypothetical protein
MILKQWKNLEMEKFRNGKTAKILSCQLNRVCAIFVYLSNC